MREFTSDDLASLLAEQDSPCISVYQPTHRHHPENQQDPIRYRQLLKQVEESLQENYRIQDLAPLLQRFHSLESDSQFWNHRTDGLAVLGSPDTLQVIDLQQPVPELVVVADSFHTKPLLQSLQSADRYQVLCLGRQAASLYEGNRIALDPVDLSDVSAFLRDALGEVTRWERHRAEVDILAKADRGNDREVTPPVFEIRSEKTNEVEADLHQFFRIVDRAVLDYHSRPTSLPLMLAALKEYRTPFHANSRNPYLLSFGVNINPESLTLDQLRAEAWKAIEPSYRERLTQLTEKYQTSHSNNLGSDDVQQIAEATLLGRVGTLLVEADREIPGKLNLATGKVEPGQLSDPKLDDVLDDLAEMVLKMNGQVTVVPADGMPSKTGLAAVYRF